VFSVFKPNMMLNLILQSAKWNLKLLGMKGEIRPAGNAFFAARIWSAVLALICSALVYIFTDVLVIAYVMK